MKITTLILSFLVFVFILVLAPIASAEQHPIPEFSVSFNNHGTEKKDSKYSAVESGTSTVLVISNAMIYLWKDDDGDEYYPKLTVKLDLDANKKTNFYIKAFLDENDGYGWFSTDTPGFDPSDLFTLEEGYSPNEGLMDIDWLFGGKSKKMINMKIEIYYENESLACAIGPDDDPDLKDIPIEGDDYDVKEDPFAAGTPSPSPTPTPCDPENISVNPNVPNVLKLNREDVTVTVTGANDCAVEGETVTAIINSAGKKRISVSPTSVSTDENGQATFTITAKKKAGVARITFKAGDVSKSITVKVK